MEGLSDKSIVDLCISRDASAWSTFVDRFSKLVYWAIKDKLSKWNYHFIEQDVEDIYQDFFISLWEKDKLAEIKDRSHISAWLVMVAGNMSIDYFRRKKNEPTKISLPIFQEAFSDKREGIEDQMPAYLHSGSKDDPSRTAHLKELNQVLTLTIDSLPPRERQAITLCYFYGKKHREIAQLLKISINTV